MYRTLLAIIVIAGCTSKSKYSPSILINEQIDTIIVHEQNEENKGLVSDYFENYEIIQLETTPESLIGTIDRISLFDNRIFILDNLTKSILVFNQKGKFIFRIKTIGKGPGEYLILSDFDLDRENKSIILYSDRPNKILQYDFDGNYLKETKLEEEIYSNISVLKDNIMLYAISPQIGEYISEFSKDNISLRERHFDISEFSLKYPYQRTRYPLTCRSANIHFYAPLDYHIYQVSDGNVSAKYFLDFGKKSIKNILTEKVSNEDFYATLKDEKAGFHLSNFRELDKHIMFKYEPNMLVIYSKKERKANTYKYLENDLGGFPISNYFAHDGDDNSILDIIEPTYLARYKEIMKRHKIKLNEEFVQLVQNSNTKQNPIILKYHSHTD